MEKQTVVVGGEKFTVRRSLGCAFMFRVADGNGCLVGRVQSQADGSFVVFGTFGAHFGSADSLQQAIGILLDRDRQIGD